MEDGDTRVEMQGKAGKIRDRERKFKRSRETWVQLAIANLLTKFEISYGHGF